jgi:hypothetical protein
MGGFSGFYLDVGNPATQTVEYNMQFAKELAEAGMIKSVEEYVLVRDTGRVDLFTSPESEENMLIESENDQLMRGENPLVLATDNHKLHIKRNSSPLKSPESRLRPEIVEPCTAHLLEHIRQANDVNNSELLAALGGAPAAGPGGAGPAPVPGPGGEMPQMPQNPLTGQEFEGQTGGGVVPPQ